MVKASGNRLIGRVLLLSALGCGASGLLLLPVHAMFGLVLSAVALADLGLVWLLRSRWPDGHPEASLASR